MLEVYTSHFLSIFESILKQIQKCTIYSLIYSQMLVRKIVKNMYIEKEDFNYHNLIIIYF